ncbi:hypothetical protein J1605_010973 [Eschrichtius robustus]|uniref:Zinc finger PHD-type domain-containing protein n=1 Tax=Eschrichtius robustus TaxID=9764 RepID=A0AB34GST1_ESCRO|nr:hypothetical protein J1605_010973 [Eschrichtius robustus]
MRVDSTSPSLCAAAEPQAVDRRAVWMVQGSGWAVGGAQRAAGGCRATGRFPGVGRSEFTDTILSVHPSDVLDMPVDPNEPTYCLCHQVSYGEMIGCDNPDCPIEWFHFACVDLTTKPKGKWSVWAPAFLENWVLSTVRSGKEEEEVRKRRTPGPEEHVNTSLHSRRNILSSF